MGLQETGKELCCTWDGQYRPKTMLALFAGSMVILSSIFALIDVFDTAFNVLKTVQILWNVVFGVLMLFKEFKVTT